MKSKIRNHLLDLRIDVDVPFIKKGNGLHENYYAYENKMKNLPHIRQIRF